ncbi:2-polyprenyl-6-methoxyphenol hydroxylase-like FAD-dependent oxidoreductase [Streptomyces sp. 840.1]|uniref:FAD-dependent monooxygenase n=1 Tax=Streptomyces sp. 840.1 TaxID=2485152 RepID=UPI000F483C30|nr:FAD-dependent monooxygenase [Streptomyces sp. 840.1]ROQ66855.1 2-polyprenyl-6-methoxyphenol hydroxylase-like FAD-dependent oxidoreductase [Streptomyces sp. 840.1]
MPETQTTTVLIVGAGPTGLTLAVDLARRGIGVRIIDKSPHFPRSSRAKGPNPRSLEVLEDLGVVERVLSAGSAPLPMRKYRSGEVIAQTDPFAAARPAPDAPYDRPWLIAQWRLEEILRARLAEYGVRVELGAELVGLAQDDDCVTASLAGGGEIGARYAVGCDGGHSAVRKLLGVPFEGSTDESQAMVCGDVEAEGPERGVWHQWFDEDGGVMLCPIPGTRSGWWFQAAPETDVEGRHVPPSLESFQRLFAKHTRLPGDRLSRATLLSAYRVNERLADRYRVGRVFLAGDAAHVHAIAGGLGMNTGIQDAYNLGWKLARTATGRAAPELLDTYQEERLPIAARTLDITSERLRATLEAIKEPGGGLDSAVTPQTYGLGDGYRWSSLAPAGATARLRAGDRAPDAPCADAATGAPRRLFEAFAGPHFTLLGFGTGTAPALRGAAAAHAGELRAHGVDAGDAGGLADHRGHARSAYGIGPDEDVLVLIRPDNHVGLIAPGGGHRAVAAYLKGAALERA